MCSAAKEWLTIAITNASNSEVFKFGHTKYLGDSSEWASNDITPVAQEISVDESMSGYENDGANQFSLDV